MHNEICFMIMAALFTFGCRCSYHTCGSYSHATTFTHTHTLTHSNLQITQPPPTFVFHSLFPSAEPRQPRQDAAQDGPQRGFVRCFACGRRGGCRHIGACTKDWSSGPGECSLDRTPTSPHRKSLCSVVSLTLKVYITYVVFFMRVSSHRAWFCLSHFVVLFLCFSLHIICV